MTWQDWWDEVRAAIANPAWTANLIQSVVGSLVGTAIALVGAGIILIRQLRHDRELAAQQALEARESWLADRRALASNEVGTILLEAAKELDFDDEDDWVKRLRQTRPPDGSIYAIINSDRIPGLQKVRTARDLAKLRLSPDSTISDLESEIAGRWYVSLRLFDNPSLARLSPAQVTTVVHPDLQLQHVSHLQRAATGARAGLLPVGRAWRPTRTGEPDGLGAFRKRKRAAQGAKLVAATQGGRRRSCQIDPDARVLTFVMDDVLDANHLVGLPMSIFCSR